MISRTNRGEMFDLDLVFKSHTKTSGIELFTRHGILKKVGTFVERRENELFCIFIFFFHKKNYTMTP